MFHGLSTAWVLDILLDLNQALAVVLVDVHAVLLLQFHVHVVDFTGANYSSLSISISSTRPIDVTDFPRLVGKGGSTTSLDGSHGTCHSLLLTDVRAEVRLSELGLSDELILILLDLERIFLVLFQLIRTELDILLKRNSLCFHPF